LAFSQALCIVEILSKATKKTELSLVKTELDSIQELVGAMV